MPDHRSDPCSPPVLAPETQVVTDMQAGRILVTGEVDIASVDEVTPALLKVEASDARAVVLDLSAVTFLDSTGVRMLLAAEARSRANGHRLTVVSCPAVDRLIDLCGLRDRLPLNGTA